MTDLTPNNEQIPAANMSKYPCHAEWPLESYRTITERTSADGAAEVTYGCPIEKNFDLYNHDTANNLVADIDADTFKMYQPPFYVKEDRTVDTALSTSGEVLKACAVCFSDKTNEYAKKLLEDGVISQLPQFQYYCCDPTNVHHLDLLLKFANSDDASSWVGYKHLFE
jgi:hypothetical protein